MNSIVLVLGLLALALCATPERMLFLVIVISPYLSLIRRIVNSQSGRVELDTLSLWPFLGLSLAAVVSLSRPRVRKSPLMATRLSFAAAIAGLAVMGLTGRVNVDSIYTLLASLAPVALVPRVMSGRLTDVWPRLATVFVIAMIPSAIYGVYQFYFLPQWDRAWMASADMSSIGAPLPMQVRVFGTAESPGPYAAYLMLAISIALYKGLAGRRASGLQWTLLAVGFVFPLLLTAVRSALLAALLGAGLLIVAHGRGLARALPVIPVVVAVVLLPRLINAVSGVSTVLVDDRYSGFDATSDDSLRARLQMSQYLTRPGAYLLGSHTGRSDNLMVDLIVNLGYVAGVLLTATFCWFLIIAIRNLFARRESIGSIAVVVVLLLSFAGNPFLSSFSAICSVAFASAARDFENSTPRRARRLQTRRDPVGFYRGH